MLCEVVGSDTGSVQAEAECWLPSGYSGLLKLIFTYKSPGNLV